MSSGSRRTAGPDPPTGGSSRSRSGSPRALGTALAEAHTVVLDCVTIWMSNLLLADELFDESRAEAHARRSWLRSASGAAGATVIIVTNEVGSGVVPETVLGQQVPAIARAGQTR